jgi:hypothetical protein
LVISDIDGTITKSDVLGHVIPAIGGTWAHSGVAELYTRIKNNGSNQSLLLINNLTICPKHFQLSNGLFVLARNWPIALYQNIFAKHCPRLTNIARWAGSSIAHIRFNGIQKVMI